MAQLYSDLGTLSNKVDMNWLNFGFRGSRIDRSVGEILETRPTHSSPRVLA